MSEGSHRPASEAGDLRGYRKEPEVALGETGKVAHMLDDRHARCQQGRVHRPGPIGRIVDVQGVYPYQRHALRDQVLSGVTGKKRMIRLVLFGSPVNVPTGLHQNRLSLQVDALECLPADGPPFV